MTARDLYALVKEYFDYKINMMSYNSEKEEVRGIIYESFFLYCFMDNAKNEFRAELRYSDSDYVIREFLGKKSIGTLDVESIHNSLQIVDDYCRLRLPDKFLEAHYKAYVLSQYDDYDL